jgi:hypothetical protein
MQTKYCLHMLPVILGNNHNLRINSVLKSRVAFFVSLINKKIRADVFKSVNESSKSFALKYTCMVDPINRFNIEFIRLQH